MMQTLARALKRHWDWLALVIIALATRLYLLHMYDIELSQDGFDAVRTLTILQTQDIGTVPRDLIDRFILHPLYMLLLGALRVITPASVDFYIVARLFSSLIACIAIILLFEFTRRAFGDIAAWVAALGLAFAPSFLWESVAILSSTTFLTLYIAVLIALMQSHYRVAACLAFLAAITRYEGVVLIALVFIALLARPRRFSKAFRSDWLAGIAFALAFPLTLISTGALATGNALEFLGAQSMASIWLRFLAPGDFANRGAFFITHYPALFPTLLVWLGVAGAIAALIWHRNRATALLLGTSALYLLFFELLVWYNYTTLEVRFLMYPGLPLLVFAGVTLSDACVWIIQRVKSYPRRQRAAKLILDMTIPGIVAALCVIGYQQGDLGMRYIYNSMASMRQMADELAHIVPPNQETNLMVYSGNSGALDMFARQHNLQLTFTDFRYAPDSNPEQFLIDHRIQFVIYPVGNLFAQGKYPYLAKFETQVHGAITFKPITQFATTTDNQLYSIWAISYPG